MNQLVQAIFRKFLVRYGRLWLDRYAGTGLSPQEVEDEWAHELAGFTEQEIRRGLDGCRTLKFPPTLPEFSALCRPATSVRPSGDEAWAIAIKAKDEAETVVWTTDMAEAWAICKPIMDIGDEIGARMAFKAAYERMSGCEWTVSVGWDTERRAVAMEQAQKRGLALPYEAPLLLESVRSPMPQYVKDLLDKLKVEGPSKADTDRQWMAQRKAEEARKVEDYQRRNGQ